MSRARDEHEARRALVAGLGKDLSRRARSRCELCGQTGALQVVEVAPIPEDPVTESALLLCGSCSELLGSTTALDKRLKRDGPESLRFLSESVWSDTAPVQVVVVRMLRRLLEKGYAWAGEPLESVWLDEERETWISASPI